MKNKHLRLKPFAITMGIALFLFSTAFIASNVRNMSGKKSVSSLLAENEYLTSLRANLKTGTVTPSDYQKAYKEVMSFRKHTKNTNAVDLNWESCGPDNLAGRMRAIVAYKDYWYAGSPDGGLWRTPFSASTTNNYVWTKINSSIYNISCMYVANDGTLYIGTGEGFYSESFNLLPGFRGTGIWKTTDGTTFTSLTSTVPTNNSNSSNDWFYVSKITQSNSKLYAATNTGLQVSSDNGSTWTKVLEGDCSDVTSSSGVVIAFVNSLAYRSTDGNTFTCISTSYYESGSLVNSNMLPRDSVGRMTFAIAPSDNNVIYATAIHKYDIAATKSYNEIGTLKNIYCSTDSGNTWTVIGPGSGWTMFYVFNGNGLYATAMTVDPTNPYRIFVGGMDLWEGKKVSGNDIYEWTQRTSAENSSALAYIPQNHFQYMYTTTPEYGETIVIACENGIYMSFKQGNYSRSASCNINLITSQFYSVASSYNDAIMGGSQGNGTVGIVKGSYSGKYGKNLHFTLGTLTSNDYTFDNIGGYCHYSMIYPIGSFISINGNNDLKDESQTAFADFSGKQRLILYRMDDQVPQDISYWYSSSSYFKAIEDSASYITPSYLWENFDWQYSKDSVKYTDTIGHSAGETIYAKSTNASYPIPVTLKKDLPANTPLMVSDKVASRFFIGVNNLIFMTKDATNFNVDFTNSDPWWIISARDLGGVTGTPQCMTPSKDCNYLFVGTNTGKLYRISNIAYAVDAKSGRACTYNAAFSTCTLNPYCVINTTEIETPFEAGRVITSISVNPNDPNIIVVTLGNYGYTDYIYICENALSQTPTFRKVDFLNIPVYTSTFIENDESDLQNLLLIGTDFGIYEYSDIVNSNTYSEEYTGMDNVPVFMIRQQNINTVCDTINGEPHYRPVFVIDHENETSDTAYITSYRNIYVATYGGGIYKCTYFNKQNKNTNNPSGIDVTNSSINKNMTVYPNPVIDNVNVKVNTKAGSHVEMYIYDLQGNIVRSANSISYDNTLQYSFNTADLPIGVYMIKVITATGNYSSKFVIVK